MKKRIRFMTAVMLLGACILPAKTMAAEDITNVNPAGDTEVTASVSNSGDVTYIISIPDKINFGALQQPSDNTTPHLATRNYSVEAVQITGLDTTTSRVAVLLKDAESNGGFQLVGQSAANRGKTLVYSVCNDADADITTGKVFPNGHLLVAFEKSGQALSGKLKLDQNQLFGKELDEWAGSYKGTIHFYSTIKSLADVK